MAYTSLTWFYLSKLKFFTQYFDNNSIDELLYWSYCLNDFFVGFYIQVGGCCFKPEFRLPRKRKTEHFADDKIILKIK